MRLNLDCVRSILLCVEENTSVRKACCFVDSSLDDINQKTGISTSEPPYYQINLLERYSIEELIYHVTYCLEADLICRFGTPSRYNILIKDLTPKGHDFLENIRNSNIWSGVKGIAEKVGSKSLNAVTQIASNVVTEIIKAQLKSGGILPPI